MKIPSTLNLDKVTNPVKNLVKNKKLREDIKNIQGFFNNPPEKKTTEDIRKIFFISTLIIGLLFLLLFLGSDISFGFLITLVLWVLFFLKSLKFYKEGIYSFNAMMFLFILIFFVSFILVSFSL